MERYKDVYLFFLACYTAALLGIVVLHGHLVVTTPYGRFSYDSLNYADVARNIVEGRGITQSAIGFNEARFSPDLPVPMPMTSQPPLYPLLAAFLAAVGVPVVTGSLIVTISGMGMVLMGGFWLARQLYGDAGALLAGTGMLAFAPLYFVTGRAWSDTLATGLALFTLALVVTAQRAEKLAVWPALLAGVLSGLAFATRYAFLPLIPLGALALLDLKNRQRTLHSLGLYLAGAMLIVGLVIGRNLIVDGTLAGSPRHASTSGLGKNLSDTFLAMFGTYLGDPYFLPALETLLNQSLDISTGLAIGIFLLSLAVLIGVLLYRRCLRQAIIDQQRYLLLAWMAAYLGLLVFQRTLFHFDIIRSRLVFPASIVLVILMSGLLVQALSIRPWVALFPTLFLALFALYQAGEAARAPEMSLQEFTERSIADLPVLDWLHRNTAEDDLIIGDDPVDVVFYLNRHTAVSFSPYPYSDYLEYEELMTFLERHCASYRNIYLFVRSLKTDEAHWMAEFGPFITDLAMNRLDAYPNVILRMPVDEAMIYQLRCPTAG